MLRAAAAPQTEHLLSYFLFPTPVSVFLFQNFDMQITTFAATN